jgi:hypothetical protein
MLVYRNHVRREYRYRNLRKSRVFTQNIQGAALSGIERHSVEFIDENGGGPAGCGLKSDGRKKDQARRKKN